MGLKKVCEKIILIIVTLSLLLTFVVAPSSYAKLTLKDGEFYYAGTTKGTYTASEGIFSWLLDNLSQIADWLVGIMTLGPRMVFVGWTALIERILTWTLETTTGVNINGDGVDSSTDLSSITDSSSNITVQAIVYNQVPAFDINFFDIKYDPTVSGTGQTYMCDKCNEECSKCCKSSDSCDCECNGNCDGCQAYMAALEVNDEIESGEREDEKAPVVIQLKTLVAGWYYVLRLLSLAAMLIVLIGIGIKMAISTIASEKAVYKRMLVDWIAGLLILFFVHYIMWFIIDINDTLVGVIKDSANSINQVQLKQLYDKNDAKGEKKEISNEEIEISVYEEIRTRAYDPKLSVGLSGMIMYMTLVYFAVRYSLVYLKRFLTLVVLTLMGPPVGVAYALQKAMSGKSSTFKAWLTEYVMNVIIQTVHALIYAVFISQALLLSLQSVAGMIVALIFMNFALKAEKLFKQIFKMSSEGSLLESAEQAGDAERIRSNIQAARGLYMGAKPVAGALMNTPFAKAVKGAGKAGLAGAAYVAFHDRSNGKKGSNPEEIEDNESHQTTLQEGSTKGQNSTGSDEAYSTDGKPLSAEDKEEVVDSTKQLLIKGEDALKADVVAKMDAYENAPVGKRKEAAKELNIAMDNYKKHKELSLPSLGNIAKGHIQRVVDVDNHFELTPKGNGKLTFSSFIKGAFGTEHYDAKSGKFVSDGNAYYQQFNAKNLLGFTDADKKVFKEHVLGPILNGGGGMLATFAGFGLMVAHPSLGMGMIAGGTAAQRKAFKKPATDKKYKGKYTFSRFSVPTMNNIQKEVAARTNREISAISKNADSQMLKRIKNDHPELYKSLKENIDESMMSESNIDNLVKDLKVGSITTGMAGIRATTLGFAAGAGIASVAPTAATFAAGFGARRFIAHSGIGSHIEAIQKHSVKQARDQQLGFMQDGLNTEAAINQGFMKDKIERQDKEYERKAYEDFGFDLDEKGLKRKSDTSKVQEEYDKEMIALYALQGLKYNPKNGTLTPLPQEEVEKANNQDAFEENVKKRRWNY